MCHECSNRFAAGLPVEISMDSIDNGTPYQLVGAQRFSSMGSIRETAFCVSILLEPTSTTTIEFLLRAFVTLQGLVCIGPVIRFHLRPYSQILRQNSSAC